MAKRRKDEGEIEDRLRREGPVPPPVADAVGPEPVEDDPKPDELQGRHMEERVLRWLDAMGRCPDVDQHWMATARTQIELGFMALHRAIARPCRCALPEDEAHGAGESSGS